MITDWHFPTSNNHQEIKQLADELNVSFAVAQLLFSRGIRNAQKGQLFLHPNENDFYDPYLLTNMQKTVERIQQAIDEQQLIMIYGDYDADGITSTAILYDYLLSQNAKADYFIPNRFQQGYGPNLEKYKEFAQKKIQLIIAVDNGVTGKNEVDFANQNNIDTIIIDHHELPVELPDAFSIIHTSLSKDNYPFQSLSGAGTVLKVIHAMLGRLPIEYLDLASIGTIADVMPIVDENRLIVYFGLKQINQTKRPGLQQLIQASMGKQSRTVDESTIGFALAPRINSLGRMDDATEVVELLVGSDNSRLQKILEKILDANQNRQEQTKKIFDSIQDQLTQKKEQNFIIVVGENWPEGILGILAARIVEQTKKPAIVLNKEKNIAKGSGRAPKNINLFELLNKHKELFEKFGGHAGAAGMSIQVDRVELLDEKLNDELKDFLPKKEVVIELVLEANIVDTKLIDELSVLRPFGVENEIPKVLIMPQKIQQISWLGKDKQHAKIIAGITAIQFNAVQQIKKMNVGDLVVMVGQLSINEFRGVKTPQIFIDDIRKTNAPTRKQVAQKYQLIVQENQVENSINPSLIKVLSELEFVKIKNGFVQAELAPKQRQLWESKTYQLLLES